MFCLFRKKKKKVADKILPQRVNIKILCSSVEKYRLTSLETDKWLNIWKGKYMYLQYTRGIHGDYRNCWFQQGLGDAYFFNSQRGTQLRNRILQYAQIMANVTGINSDEVRYLSFVGMACVEGSADSFGRIFNCFYTCYQIFAFG